MEDKIKNELKTAQLNRDEIRVSTLRLLLSEIKNAQIQKGETLSDEEIQSVVRREVKKRKEAAEAYRGGNRGDMAEREDKERSVLEQYLPQQLSEEEVARLVDQVIRDTGASGLSNMGKVIGAVLSKTQGQTSGEIVSRIVRAKLSS